MMLTEITTTDFPKLEGILKRNIAAGNAEDRTSFDYVKATATLLDAQGNLGVWVDNLDDPHAVLIVTKGKFGVLNEIYCFVNTIYVDPEHRSEEVVKQMVTTSELWASAHGCKTLQISSWIYKGAADVGSLWKKLGFAPQETIFVKEV